MQKNSCVQMMTISMHAGKRWDRSGCIPSCRSASLGTIGRVDAVEHACNDSSRVRLTNKHAHTFAHMHTHNTHNTHNTHAHTFTHLHTYIHTHARARTHTYTHTYTHNVQVATDTRLWLYKELHQIRGALQELIMITSERAEKEADVLMPGACCFLCALLPVLCTQKWHRK